MRRTINTPPFVVNSEMVCSLEKEAKSGFLMIKQTKNPN